MFKRKAHMEVIVYKDPINSHLIDKAVVVFTIYGKLTTFVYCRHYPTIQELRSIVPEVKDAIIFNSVKVMASDILDFLTLDGVSKVTTNSVSSLAKVLEHDINTKVVFKFNELTDDFCDDLGFEAFMLQDIKFIEREGRDYYRPENTKLTDALKLIYSREEFAKESLWYRLMVLGLGAATLIATFLEGVFICRHI